MNRVMQKEIAVACLEKLGIYGPYVRKFQSIKTIPCFFENFGGFYADQEPELWAKVKEVESEYGCLVYAITHEYFEFGECWSMLCVSKDTKEVHDCLDQYKPKSYYAFAYVWNQTNEQLSEFGDVVVQSFGGGIRRIG
jgi:hypothetical protein